MTSPPPSASESKRANRDMPVYQSSQYAKNVSDGVSTSSHRQQGHRWLTVLQFGHGPQSMSGESSYTGHHHRPLIPSTPHRSGHAPSHSISSSYNAQPISPPPQASIHPGPGSRRRSDYVEHSNQAYSGYSAPQAPLSPRATIDYPQAHALAMVPQPPPPTQSHAMEKYDTRPSVVRSGSIRGLDLVSGGGDDVRYWNDVALGLTGLKNLGK